MIKLYTSPTPNGRKISILLEELNAEYETILIDLGKKESWKKVDWDLLPTKIKDNIDNCLNLRLVQNLNEIRKKSKSFRNNIISLYSSNYFLFSSFDCNLYFRMVPTFK